MSKLFTKLILPFLAILILPITAIYAETYKWEDANGVHYSDNASSVPEKYREKVFEETKAENTRITPPVSIRSSQPSSTNIQANQNAIIQANQNAINQANRDAIYQANVEQQRRAVDAMRQQQSKALAQSTQNAEGAIESLARFMAIWVLIGLGVFIIWVLTIVDIVRSEFTSPSNKTVWILLVILIPVIGMLLYHVFGSSQKSNHIGYKDKEQAELLARLKPRDPDGKDFII